MAGSLSMRHLMAALCVLACLACGYAEQTTVFPEDDFKCTKPEIDQSSIVSSSSNVSNDLYAVGDVVEIRCSAGFRFPHKSPMLQVVCVESYGMAVWRDVLGSVPPRTCSRIGSCPVPVIRNGRVIGKADGYMPGEGAPLLCEARYAVKPANSSFLMCQSDGSWKTSNGYPALPTCEVPLCGPPPEIENSDPPVVYDALPDGPLYIEKMRALYRCDDGYKMSTEVKNPLICVNGEWNPPSPKCVRDTGDSKCSFPSDVPFGWLVVYDLQGNKLNASEVPESSMVRYFCNYGYKIQGNILRTCKHGLWNERQPSCMPIMGCTQPPIIPNGVYKYFSGDSAAEYRDKVPGDTKIYYSCDDGYVLKGRSSTGFATLICSDGAWHGTVPRCEKKTHCDPPDDIHNGNWVIDGLYADYRLGMRIFYECDDEYKAIGETRLVCDDHGHWSDHPPKCLQNEMYCSEPGVVENGFYLCRPHACDLYSVNTEVHYVCNRNFEPNPEDVMQQMCLAGGIWSSRKPVCLPVAMAAANTDNTGGNGLDINTSTLTVVIATSCSVLGLLLLVMVVFALQRRRKLSPRILSSSDPSVPPPYSPQQENALNEEQDRVALIAFADGVQVVLPSYEEAVRGRSNGPRLSRFNSDSSHSSGRSARSEYRPLPSIPQSWRGGMGYPSQLPPDHHRNSIITTTSTTTRDNLSLAFGSMDTMNASDGTSTTVTIGTYDSAGSNPSIATSQRAAVGSLGSGESRASLATEDAPLLEQDNSGGEPPPRCSTSHSHRETASPQPDQTDASSGKFEGVENHTL